MLRTPSSCRPDMSPHAGKGAEDVTFDRHPPVCIAVFAAVLLLLLLQFKAAAISIPSSANVLYAIDPDCTDNDRRHIIQEAVTTAIQQVTSDESLSVSPANDNLETSSVLITVYELSSVQAPVPSSNQCRLVDTWMKDLYAGGFSITDCQGQAADALIKVLNDSKWVRAAEQAKFAKSALCKNVEHINTFDQDAPGFPNDPLFPWQWQVLTSNHFSVKAEALWEPGGGVSSKEPSNTIGVVDRGFMKDHTELMNQWYEGGPDTCRNKTDDDSNLLPDDCSLWNFMHNNNTIFDGSASHGTLVSSVAAAEINNGRGMASVCQNCRILPVAVDYSYYQIMLATSYLLAKKITVINFSFIGPPSSVLFHVMKLAESILFVVAAGNGGADMDERTQPLVDPDGSATLATGLSLRKTTSSASAPAFHLPPFQAKGRFAAQSSADCDISHQTHDKDAFYPAAYSSLLLNVVAVGSIDEFGNRAGFTNYGRTTVQVFAPGQKVVAAGRLGDEVFVSASGTAFSAPMVAAIATMIQMRNPDLRPCQIRTILKDSCNPNPDLKGMASCNGQVDAVASVKASTSMTPGPCDVDPNTSTSTASTAPASTAPASTAPASTAPASTAPASTSSPPVVTSSSTVGPPPPTDFLSIVAAVGTEVALRKALYAVLATRIIKYIWS